MQNDDLAIYLNDHLAGSVGALEMLDHLIKTYEGKPIAQLCREWREEISADQDALRDIMRALDVKESGRAQSWRMDRRKTWANGNWGLKAKARVTQDCLLPWKLSCLESRVRKFCGAHSRSCRRIGRRCSDLILRVCRSARWSRVNA